MILNKEKGMRMWGGDGGSGGSGGSSFDPSSLSGYAQQSWVNDNFVSKAFWNQVFEIHGTQTVTVTDENDDPVGSPVVTDITFLPNEAPGTTTSVDEETGYTTTTVRAITSIEAKVGLWTNSYLSALGQNSSGGGGGGATLFEPLLSINESGLAAPAAAQDGMTVVWDNTNRKWKYGSAGGGEYLPLTGGTMRGVITLGNSTAEGNVYSSAINVGLRTTGGTRASFYTSGSYIHGGEDNASQDGANVQIGTWYGFGIYPTISDPSVTRTQGKNSFWHNARTGNTYTWGDFYCFDGTNNNKVATEKWVRANTVDYIGDVAVDFNFADGHDLGGGVYQLHTNNTQTHKPTVYGILIDFESQNGHIQLASGPDHKMYFRSYWWTNNPDGFEYPDWQTLATQSWVSGSYLSKTEAANTYLSIAFFNRLFQARNGSTAVNPNDTTSTIDNIKAMFGFWTDQYLSALGQNSGGGSGGATSLYDLVDVNIPSTMSQANDGQVLMYNAQQNRWINGSLPATGVTSIAAGTGLTTDQTGGAAITNTGTISISSTYQTYISHGESAYNSLSNYLPLTGGTMRGVITLGNSTAEGNVYSSAINVGLRTTGGTRASFYTSGNYIHGGEDNASQDGANVQIGTWYGFGIYPTISGMTRTQGKNSFWHNARTGNTYTWGNFYCYDGTNNNKVATENWVSGAYLPLAGGTMTGTLYMTVGVGIQASNNAGLLVYKPSSGSWTGVSNTQWCVGALDAQGVIRSNNNSLLHFNGSNSYKIWDEGNDGSGSGLDADLLDGIHAKDMLIHYQLPRNATASTYWHKLGEYETGGDNSNLILEVYSGSGYNANGSQNSWAKIIIKDGWQSQTSETNSVGVSVEEYGYYSTGIKVIVVATAHNKGAVWVQLPWQYAVGDYVVYGRYKSWTHNDSTTTDTTTAPTSNQNPVYYYRNLSYMNGAGEQAVTLPHNMSVKAGMDGAQLRIGNMLLTYDATNKALKIEHQGSNGVESGNFYATGAVSALGANTSGGGGGGGSSTLADLLDVTLSSPSNGQVLTYDSAIGKWINATIPTPSMEGYATQNWVQQNYATLAAISDMATQTWVGQQGFLTSSDISDMATKTWVGQQGYLTSSAISDMATKTWVGQQGFLTSSDISDMATKTWVGQQGYLTSSAISDMATKTWVGQQGFVTSSAISDMATKTWVGQNYLGINATAAAATKLVTARYLWGQSFDGTDNVSGSISAGSNGGSILQFHSIELNSAGTLANYGGFIDFHFNGSAADYTSRIIEDAVGVLSINAKDATSPYNYRKAGLRIGDGVNESFLQIGNVRLIYDQTNNALKVEKYDGTTANFYATGGVSALGVPTAGSGTVDTLNVNTLKAISNLYIGDNNTRIYYDYNDDVLTLQSGSGDISFKGTLTMDGSTTSQRHINTRGGNVYLSSGYLYLSSSVYLYTDGSNVKVNINGTTYTLTKS